MMAEEIKAKYKALHDKLSERYYEGHGLTKEDFDRQHGKIWNDMEAKLIAEGYRIPPEPPRDLATEIDELRARVEKIGIIRRKICYQI